MGTAGIASVTGQVTAGISAQQAATDAVVVDERALAGLKFSEALPPRLATATLAARLEDLDSAAQAIAEPVQFSGTDGAACGDGHLLNYFPLKNPRGGA
jgi:hypothetical protein